MEPSYFYNGTDSLPELEVSECIRRFEVIISIAKRRLNAEGERSCAGNFFDCNICLNKARDPVLTRCGHLFCWPCLHQLAYVYSNARECPVCNGEVIETEIIPIYGTAGAIANREPACLRTPPRPAAPGTETFRVPRINPAECSAVLEGLRILALNGESGVRVQSQNPNAATHRNTTQSRLDSTYDQGTDSSPFFMFSVPGTGSISSPDSLSGMDIHTTADIGSEIQTTDTNIQPETNPVDPSSPSHI